MVYNEDKPKEQRINEDKTQDSFQMMRKERNKEETEIEPGVVCPNDKKQKEESIKLRQNLGLCPNYEKPNEQRIN